MKRVCGKVFITTAARLDHYACFLLKGKIYPGMISCTGGVVRAVLHRGVDFDSLKRLDDFEDDIYERQCIIVTDDSGREHEAQAYVMPMSCASTVSDMLWDERHFVAVHLPMYLAGTRALN